MSETKPLTKQQVTNASMGTVVSAEKVVEAKSETVSQVLTLQAKKQLKQQGKQLLLKGCYRMAATKYTRIIDAGIKDFTARQQAIIYLNCGICFQFMSDNNRQNYVRALEYMRNALMADYSYEKTYYRLIQLLRDNGHLQEILTLVPSTIQNKEIDDLLKEVREQYMNESDLGRIIQKYKTESLSVSIGRALCTRLYESIGKILITTDPDFMTQIKSANFRTQVLDIGKQLQSAYELIGTNDLDYKNLAATEITQTRASLMECFMKSVEFAFVSCIDDKAKIATVDLILQPMLKLYRGELSKYLNREFQFKNPQLKLAKQSKFLTNNQFVTFSKRTFFFKGEMSIFKYIRLIDVSFELFGKLYCHLSNKYYQRQKNKISNILPKESSQFDNLTLTKYVYANILATQEIVFSGLTFINTKMDTKMFFGYKSVYIYKNLDIVDLNFMKEVLDEECQKLSQVFACVVIHPVWMECLKDMIHTIDKLLDILLGLVEIYSYRESKTVKSLVNELSCVSELSHLIYIYHWQVQAFNQRNRTQQNKETQNQGPLVPYNFNYKYEHLLNYFEKENQNFIALYLIQKIIQFAQQGSSKTGSSKPVTSPKKNAKQSKFPQQKQDFSGHKERAIQICIKKVKTVEKKIQELKKNKSTEPYVYKEMYLILICMILKMDIKRKIQIDSSIIFKQVFKEVVDEMALEVLLLILINSPMELHKYLANQKQITTLVNNFMSKPLLEQLQPFKILLNLIYIMVCDFQNDQEIFFAKKLGVSQQDVHQVRKLQKQSMQDKEREQLNKLKKKFKTYIASQWHQILIKMCKMLRVNLKMQAQCSSKLCKVIQTIAETNHSKLYSAQIIQFMLEAKSIKDAKNSLQTNTKQSACKFFQILCKKCNAQIFEYKHIQGIVDSLLWLISNCEHELVYFESLLGLVNLSTMSVRIPIEQIEKCLYEENSYIMHAGVCVMNNILIYSEQLQQENQKNTKTKSRISELVYKYIEFYRDQIINLEIQLPQTDYSHPKKIYNSLMSLATVLKLDKLQELTSWTDAIKYIKILSGTEASQLMFKLAIYHSMEKTLPRNWNQNLLQEMEHLKKIDLPKYLKLAQLI